MRTKIEEDYSQETIEAFAKGADQNPPDPDSEAALQAFSDDLAECNTGG